MTSILKVDQVEGASGTTLKLQEQTIQIQDTFNILVILI